MRKRLTLLLIILFSCTILTSCIPVTQLTARALVQAIGIDYEGGEIQLTLQIFSPASEGANGLGASSKNAKIIESSGKTITEAVQNANLVQGKEIFIGHNRIIILGHSFVEKNLDEALSYFSSIPISRKNASLVIAENKASEIIKANINQGILPAETLQKIIENNSNNGLIENIMFYEFMRTYRTSSEATILPIITLRFNKNVVAAAGDAKEKQNDGKIQDVSSLIINGMAVISNGEIVGQLNSEEIRGTLWIRDAIKHTTLVTSTDKFKVAALDIYNVKSKLTPIINDNEMKIVLTINCGATLNETILQKNAIINNQDIEAIKKAAGDKIESDCNLAYQKAIIDYKADIFNFGRLFEKEDKELWKSMKDNWGDNAKKIKFEVHANVDTDRLGLSFQKTQKPQD